MKEYNIIEKNKIVIILLALLLLGLGYIFGEQDDSVSIDMASATKNCMDIWESQKVKWGDTGHDLDSWKVVYNKKKDKCVAGHNDTAQVLVVDILSSNFLFYWSDFQFIGSEEEKLKEWGKANNEYQKYFGF